MRGWKIGRRKANALLIAGALFMPAAAPGSPCGDVGLLPVAQGLVTGAVEVPAGTFAAPGGAAAANLPAFCRVTGTLTPSATSRIRFEVWLPANGWNGKYHQVGNGGFAGAIPHDAMALPLQRGYAVAATDDGTGPQGDNGFLADIERVTDWASRAVHLTALTGKQITQAYYGSAPKHAYFAGCSKGGQEAMMESQRHPEDFDGIIGGDPAFHGTRLLAQMLWNARAAGDLAPAKLALLNQAVLAACDKAGDNLADGVVGDPAACRFDPASLKCRGADGAHCLTEAEIDATRQVYAGPAAAGSPLYAGMWPGGEAPPAGLEVAGVGPILHGWQAFNWLATVFPQPFFGIGLFHSPTWDWRSFDFDRDLRRAERQFGGVLNATDTNLSGFRNRGGKLLLYMGASDPFYSAEALAQYYDQLVQRAGDLDRGRAFARLFLVPGMGHCSAGPGTDRFDMLTALEQWVEQGKAPDLVPAAHIDPATGRQDRVRPLCAWPQRARFTGKGRPDELHAFACVAPAG